MEVFESRTILARDIPWQSPQFSLTILKSNFQFFQLFFAAILSVSRVVELLAPNPEHLGSTPNIPRTTTTSDFRHIEFGFKRSNLSGLEDDFRGSVQVQYGSNRAIENENEVTYSLFRETPPSPLMMSLTEYS